MAIARPAQKDPDGPSVPVTRNNLWLRVVSSLVLAPVALIAAYVGGIPFAVFWTIAAIGVLWEWNTLICAHDRNSVFAIAVVTLIGAILLFLDSWPGTAIAFITLGAFGVATLASRVRRLWCAGGLLYSAALLFAPVLLRNDPRWGWAAIVFLFVIVWLTDIVAYFVGRTVGGPKLMPAVSPNKTWSGAIGGTLAGVIGGAVVAWYFGASHQLMATAFIALVLSILSQVGDLAESAIKRRFRAKDTSNLIPGHGGLMDRLDGFVAAVAAAVIIGLAHGGLGAPARGLMVW